MEAKYTLLIVDDDDDVLSALSVEEEWRGRGFRLVGTSGSAEEAMALCRLYKPDVVLSDIRMAEMSGLEMIECLSESGSQTVFVILSGYNRFEYAQTAVRLGVFEYLSKPVDDKKLDATFGRLRRQLDARNIQKKTSISDARALCAYREIFLTGLLTHSIDEEAARERIEELGLSMPRGRFRVAVIGIRRLAVEHEALVAPVCEYFSEAKRVAVFFKGIFVAFLDCGTPDGERAALEVLRRVPIHIQSLPRCEGALVRIGVSAPVKAMALAGKAYQEAVKALDAHFYSEQNVIHYENLPARSVDPGFEIKARSLNVRIAECVLIPDASGASDALDALFRLFEENRPLNVSRVFALCETLLDLLAARLTALGLTRDGEEQPINCERFKRADTLSALRLEMRSRVGLTCGKVRDYMRAKSSDIIWQVERYVEEHLADKITVYDVAAAIHVNADYLSRVYKKYTGENLNSFINARKMERAKAFLRASPMSVQEIAMGLGFSEYRYFSEVFKKQCGVTPLKYRRTLIDGDRLEEL